MQLAPEQRLESAPSNLAPSEPVQRMEKSMDIEMKNLLNEILHQTRHAIGLNTGIIALVATIATTATATASLTHGIQTVQTVNNLSTAMAEAFAIQNDLNKLSQAAILVIQQELDFHQEQLDILFMLQRLTYDPEFCSICVNQYTVSDNVTLQFSSFSQYIKGTWDTNYVMTIHNLTKAIVKKSMRLNINLHGLPFLPGID